MIDFTTVVGVDSAHIAEWEMTWPTWVRYRPQLLDRPLLVVCDADRPIAAWEEALRFLRHPQMTLVPWDQPSVSQREKMLTGLTLVPAHHVRTPWFLKLDTDVAAVSLSDWVPDAWFAPDVSGREPVLVAPPWGYSKPADTIQRLDEWGDTAPGLSDSPRLNLSVSPGSARIRHRRIISWCLFGRTRWLRDVTAGCDGRLPVPSHDTFLSYCAERRGDFYRRVDMQACGWVHLRSRRRLQRTCQAALTSRTTPGDNATREPTVPEITRSTHADRLCQLLSEVLVPWGPLRGAEIGVNAGATSAALLAAFPHLHLHMVDSWCAYPPDHSYRQSRSRFSRRTADQAAAAWRTALTRTQFAAHRRAVVVADSLTAAPNIPDGSLDFGFIDADHSEAAVRVDLQAWWPKIRQGGILIGHDYGRDRGGRWGVRRAVDAWASEVGLPVSTCPQSSLWWVRKPAGTGSVGPIRVYYLLTRATHAARLVVSVASLRRFYAGPVTVYTTLPESHLVGERCAADSRLQVEHRMMPHPNLRRNASYVAKVILARSVPDPGGVFLDADTLVTGDLGPLFDALTEAPFVATQFADWLSSGRVVRQRIEGWRPLAAQASNPRKFGRLLDDAIQPRPAVNSGVFGWRREAAILAPWEDLTRVGHRRCICDEVALQILVHRYPHRILDCRFNCSFTYAAGTRDVRVWHFHGGRHMRAGHGRELWLPAFRACLDADLAGLNEWADVVEPALASEMNPLRATP